MNCADDEVAQKLLEDFRDAVRQEMDVLHELTEILLYNHREFVVDNVDVAIALNRAVKHKETSKAMMERVYQRHDAFHEED